MPDGTYGDLTHSVDLLRGSIEQLRNDLVRKDVYDADSRALDRRFSTLEEDVREIKETLTSMQNERRSDRRLALSAFVGPLVILILGLYIAAQVGGAPTP